MVQAFDLPVNVRMFQAAAIFLLFILMYKTQRHIRNTKEELRMSQKEAEMTGVKDVWITFLALDKLLKIDDKWK